MWDRPEGRYHSSWTSTVRSTCKQWLVNRGVNAIGDDDGMMRKVNRPAVPPPTKVLPSGCFFILPAFDRTKANPIFYKEGRQSLLLSIPIFKSSGRRSKLFPELEPAASGSTVQLPGLHFRLYPRPFHICITTAIPLSIPHPGIYQLLIRLNNLLSEPSELSFI